ncbi:endocuticle structural glycoprotein SgAbd-8-like [Atheta coriaria]|uniref:endocuticle structural glycoprotein SgAbd-8-like n=1 Tax=Dalotia coriaria TaxID=877792 RepID=UPI0031F41FE1
MLVLFLTILPCLVIARPQEHAAVANHGGETTPIPIINSASEVGEDGSFNYSYETGNGIHYQQSAYTKKVPIIDKSSTDQEDQVIQVMTGSFSYPAPDGSIINLTYVADEHGFQPQGEHLPTPPPIPAEIQKVLDTLPQLSQDDDAQNAPPPTNHQ